MLVKPILNVYFIGIKTSQQRLVVNKLNEMYNVHKTRYNVDVLFVNEDNNYDIEYKLIFPYNQIILDDLNVIISRSLVGLGTQLKSKNVIMTQNMRTNRTYNTNTDYKYFEHDVELLRNIDNTIELYKETVVSSKQVSHPLNTIFDEIYVLNNLHNYSNWNEIQKTCISCNIFVTRWECNETLNKILIDLLIHIKGINKLNNLIIFDNNTFIVNINDIVFSPLEPINIWYNTSNQIAGISFRNDMIDELINVFKYYTDTHLNKYPKYSINIFDSYQNI